MAKFNRISADTVQRKSPLAEDSHQEMLKKAQELFKKKSTLYLICDETFSHHPYKIDLIFS